MDDFSGKNQMVEQKESTLENVLVRIIQENVKQQKKVSWELLDDSKHFMYIV